MPDPQRGSQTRNTLSLPPTVDVGRILRPAVHIALTQLLLKPFIPWRLNISQGKISGSFRSLPDSLTAMEEAREITSSPHFWLAFVPPATVTCRTFPLLYRYIALLLYRIILSRINYRITHMRRTGKGSKAVEYTQTLTVEVRKPSTVVTPQFDSAFSLLLLVHSSF